MATLQPYKKYNAIAYDYATQLPDGWQLLPNISVFQERIERGYINEELLSVTIGRGVIRQTDVDIKKDSSNEDKSKYKLIRVGDIAYNKMRMWQGALGYSDYQGISSPAYVILKPKMKINPRYFHYMFRTSFYTNYSKRFSYGIVDDQLSLRYTDFKRMYSIVPPIEVQNSIVAYLDKKNEQIDTFIRNKERLIELLEEESGSLRDSLIKDLPSELWKKLKYIRRFRNGYAFKSELFTADEGYSVIRIGDIANELDLTTCAKYPINQKVDKRYEVKNGDILIALSGATTGKVAQVDKLKDKAYLNQRVAKLDNGEPYLLLCISSLIIQKQITLIADGSAQENISNKDIENLQIPFPKKETRDKIVTEFFQRNAPLKLAIEKAQKEIDAIKEYREALVTDLITGKRSVPQLQMS
jgi:type I restriction enzyme, S subunit